MRSRDDHEMTFVSGGWNPVVAIPVALMVIYVGACAGAPLTRAVWAFGDSLIDVGNNNYIPTIARADFPYNGIDYPAGPTGRFCNGDTVLDILGALLGFPKSAPPYLQPDIVSGGPGILQGVNYASAAGGILNDTGTNYIYALSLDTQLSYFAKTICSLRTQLGSQAAVQQLLADSLFPVVIGSNDYINNYLLPLSARKSLSPQDYQDLLISNLRRQLTTLYNLGARKFVVSAVGAIGCIPSQLSQNNSNGTCVASVNQLARDFNTALQALLRCLTSSLSGSTFLYANVYDFVLNLIDNPEPFGFTVTNTGCCGAGPFNGVIPCAFYLGATVCPDRCDYVFWDPFHPTQAVNRLLGNAVFSGGPEYISPCNVRDLLTTG